MTIKALDLITYAFDRTRHAAGNAIFSLGGPPPRVINRSYKVPTPPELGTQQTATGETTAAHSQCSDPFGRGPIITLYTRN